MLGVYHLVDTEANLKFLETTSSNRGGFSKHADGYPGIYKIDLILKIIFLLDILHSYMGLAGLAIAKHPGLNNLVPSINISTRAMEHLRTTKWHQK